MRSSVSRTEAFLIALTIILSPLPASEFWASNPLSQKTGKIDGLSGSGWELSASADGEVLYSDGRVVEKKTYTEDGWILERDGVRTTVTVDAAGRPAVLVTGGEKTVNTYSGSGRLVSTVVTENDEIKSIRKYFYSYDGSAVRTDADSSVYIFSEDDFYYSLAEEEGWVIRRVADGLYMRDDADGTAEPSVEATDDGIMIRVSDEESTTWAEDGTIRERKDAEGSSKYFYEDGAMVREERTEGDRKFIISYESGNVTRKETYEKDVLSSVVYWLEDGSMKKEMYRKGSHYATVTYDRDGSTVLDVEML